MTETMPATRNRLIVPGTDVPDDLLVMERFAERLAASKMLPKHLQGEPANIMAVMLKARALNIPMSTAFDNVLVIEGKTGMSAHLIQGLVLRAGYGMYPIEDECTLDQAVVRVTRPGIGPNGEDYARVTFTIEDAIRAKLVEKRADGTLYARSAKDPSKILPWEKYGNQMLIRRDMSKSGRNYFNDVLLGMSYTPEEIGGVEDDDGNVVYRESMRADINPEIEPLALKIMECATVEDVRDVWQRIQVQGLLDERNLAGVSLRDMLTKRGDILAAKAGKKPATPKPETPPAEDAPQGADEPQNAETETSAPAGPRPDPPETREDTEDRRGICDILAMLFDGGWPEAETAIREETGLAAEDVSTDRLAVFAQKVQGQ